MKLLFRVPRQSYRPGQPPTTNDQRLGSYTNAGPQALKRTGAHS
jgi:hypothetical protein